jgi:dTDP-4-dehydrorhamnose 3,5-epimerase
MNVLGTPLAGVHLVAQEPLRDARGAFARLYCEESLQAVLGTRRIVQINASLTHEVGTVRGMHYQRPPHAEMKFIRCLRGRAWDVALDLRAGSPTFLQWHAQELAPFDGRMLVLPEGVAHGFQALEPDTELLYLHTAAYAPQAEAAVHCQEPRAAIAWPLPVRGLSPRDQAHPALAPGFTGVAA